MKRNYPKTTGYYVYMHRTPEKDVYFGMSKNQPYTRWHPSQYKTTSLQPYIEQFGWDNIEHRVLFDNLTKHQAEVLEDWFIANATQDGFCINKQRSGGICRGNRTEYDHNRYHNDPEYRETVKERSRKRQQTEEYKEWKREYNRKQRQTEEYKAYHRDYLRQWRLKKKQQC